MKTAYIDGVDITTLGAKLVRFSDDGDTPNMDYEWTSNSLSPYVHMKDARDIPLTVVILVIGLDESDAMKKVSNIVLKCRQCLINFSNHDIHYDSVLNNPKYKYLNGSIIEVTLEFRALRCSALVNKTLNNVISQTINVDGNIPCECVYTVTIPSAAVAQLIIQGIIVKNIPGSSTLVIDGVKKKVTVNGVNKFADVELTKFPTLTPGTNTISINLTTVTVSVQYRPRWY